MERNETVTQHSNGSLSPEEVGDAATFRVTKIFFYFLILSASTFGNSMVAWIITRKMRTSSNYLILNLAICDLVTPVISIVFDFILEENNYVWFYGGAMCKLLWPAQTYFTCASSLTLAAISLDRYRLIMHPFKTRLSMKQIYVLILFVHLFSMVCVSPYVYVLGLKNGSCEENWPAFTYRQGYTLFLFLAQYALPLLFMAVVYGLAVRALCNTSAKMRKNSINPNKQQRKLSNDSEKTPRRKISKTNSIMRRISRISVQIDIWSTPNAKATKMFIVVVVVFAIFMFPNQVVWLWADFGGGINSPNFTNISIVCWLFTYTNCVVNPVIFGVFSKDFRKGFKKIFESVILCFNRPEEKEVNGEVKRRESNKTVSEYLIVGESASAMECVQCNLFLPSQVGQKQTYQDLQANKHSRSSTLEESFSDLDLDQTITSNLKSVSPEGKTKHLNHYDDLTATPDEQYAMLPCLFSHKHLKEALNSSPETDC